MKLRNMDKNKKTDKIFFETGIFLTIIILLCAFGIWQSISRNWEITIGGTNFPQGFIKSGGNYQMKSLNQESVYISFLSVLFSFLGNKEEVVSILNLILQVSGIGFFYLGAKELFRHVFPLAIAVICGLLSGCFYPVISDTSMHIVWFLSGFMFWLGIKSIQSVWGKYILRILVGVLLGIFCYIDFCGFFLLITFISFILMTDELNLKGNKIPIIYFLYFLLGCISGYFVMFCFWNDFRFDTIVFQKWFQDKIRFLNPADLWNQYLSIAVILGIVIVYYLISSKKKTTADNIDNVLQQIIASEENERSFEKTKEISEEIEHVSEKAEDVSVEIEHVSEKTEEVSFEIERNSTNTTNIMKNNKGIMEEIIIEDNILRKLEKEIIMEDNVSGKVEKDTSSEDSKVEIPKDEIPNEPAKPIKLLENPLPLPKKHVKKEMNYAFEPTPDQMHYDLNNYRLDDDYDLKDI